MDFDIRRDDLSSAEVQALVREHIAGMLSNTPIESVHALPLEALQKPEITFWSVWYGNALCGCGALKELDPRHGEIKSMRTKSNFLRKGVAQAMLSRIMSEARNRGYTRLSLETGEGEAFQAARTLYERNGFQRCAPFGDYQPDPLSVFMTVTLC